MLQVNARKIYDELNVLEGILANRLFLGILGAEFALQVYICSRPLIQPLKHFYVRCIVTYMLSQRNLSHLHAENLLRLCIVYHAAGAHSAVRRRHLLHKAAVRAAMGCLHWHWSHHSHGKSGAAPASTASK